jgi:V/A-type H+-transporting ATPase subunit I
MMFNDLGYGLVFIIASLIIQKKFRLTGGTRNMIRLVLECGVTTAIFGVITGSFFGDAIPVVAGLLGRSVTIPSLLNPLQDPMSVLILSLVLGVVQILFGMGVKAYILIRDGKPLDALFDVGSWWLLFAGVAVGALCGFWWVAIAGVAALVLTQGRSKPTIPGKIVGGIASLYDITSYFSDVLSYSRLMALMLAGGIVASIVNVLGSLFGSVILFIPIFIIGHVFNIGINVIGTYVHAARLQYLEFFGKFYADGGKPFRPLDRKTKYFEIIKEESIHG